MVNFTLPDDKSNYVHRIGRVGRAEHMGLAISLVSTVPEKVKITLNHIFGINFHIHARYGIMVNGVHQEAKIAGTQT